MPPERLTVAKRAPKPPTGLREPGRALWRTLNAALPDDVEYDERERAILSLAARQADDAAALEEAVARDGATVAGSRGQPRLHPAVAELRQARIAISRLLGDLEIPDAADRPTTMPARRARKAADVRWAEHTRRKVLRDG